MFLKRKKPIDRRINDATVKFPTGAVIESTNGAHYYIKNDVRLKIDDEVLATWRFTNVPVFEEVALKSYLIAGSLPFRDGTVVDHKGKIFYFSGGRGREIKDNRWYQWLNINENDIIDVTPEVFSKQKIGAPLT